ncbi:LysE family translocator [Photobacterium atrarenae]|uniref:LysE family translocator n=1 Tax=Photobacterium atrarenae TaxID=865757 RepID=A0ABY5GMJ6_9GAMM|nr:LysE family translocator [Photobacterium atrarenae]UTV30315.1 LysE family translocator [Photobacterium atrarenae]
MDYQHLLALASFAFVSTVSPGPNNIMLMASGANVGFLRTVPHMLGIVFGFSFMVILVGVGLMGVFTAYPVVHQILQVGCLLYLFYLAFKIARSRAGSHNALDYRPLSFLAAANFQWINPKAWSMALTAVSVYNLSANWQGVVLVSAVFAAVNVPSVSVWTVAGKQLQHLLNNTERMKWFNYGMAALLVASTLPMMDF